MKAFEEDLAHMIESVSFRKVNDPFLDMIKKDIQKVNSLENVFIFADSVSTFTTQNFLFCSLFFLILNEISFINFENFLKISFL